MATDLRDVRFVAAYLRKSRGDEETALDKHRKDLTDLAARHNWRVDWFEEIGNSDSIDYRPAIKRLLGDVENDLYDAVLVMDLDRFSRGDLSDQARWRKAFESTGTLIITPTHIYNLAEDQTALLADIEGLFARFEYKMITKRLRQGKVTGAKLGRWTNGSPPLPYRYNAAAKELEVEQDKLWIYNLLKQKALDNEPFYKLAQSLNREGIPSPKGGKWQASTVQRIITSEVHLGKVVHNKTAGSAHRNRKVKPLRKRSREEWIVSEGTHQALKTPEEHARIVELMERRTIIPKRARAGTHVLSGLIRCGLCGYVMQVMTKSGGKVHVRKCLHPLTEGGICRNRGCSVEAVYVELNSFMTEYEQELLQAGAGKRPARAPAESALQTRLSELRELESGADRIQDLYIMGRIKSKAELEQKLATHDQLLRVQREEVARLRELLGKAGLSDRERLERVRAFREVWPHSEASPAEINRRLRQVVDRIVYTRGEVEISVSVKPL